MYRLDNQNEDPGYHVIHTPTPILEGFLGHKMSVDCYISPSDIDQGVLTLLDQVPIEVKQLFYALDPELLVSRTDSEFLANCGQLPIYNPDQSTEILNIVLSIYQRIRQRIYEILTNIGFEVICQKKECSPDSKDTHFCLLERQWREIAQKHGVTSKLSKVQKKNYPEGLTDLMISIQIYQESDPHPNLAEERLILSRESDYLITLAPNMKNDKTLNDLSEDLPFSDRMKILLDAFKACSHLHENCLIHGDFKPDNIFVIPEDDSYKGVLFDLEGVTVFGSPGHNLSRKTPNYYDHFYYRYPLSEQSDENGASDVFACGLTLLDILIPDNHISLILYSAFDTITPYGDPDEIEDKMLKLLDRFWDPNINSKFKDLIISTLCLDRLNRPTINEFIEEFEKLLVEFDLID
ncbi:hypothetical protein ACFL21_03600 [Patescibacteria group bacterium]